MKIIRSIFNLYPAIFSLFILVLSEPLSALDNNRDWVEKMFRQQPLPGEALLPEFTDGYGVAFRDINSDSLADLYIVRFRNLNRLFINRGPDKRFKDRTIRTGLGGNLAPRGLENLELGASVTDYDNDGTQDVLITGWGATTQLFRHTSRDLRFSRVTEESGIVLPMSGNAGVWADIDLDGDLDLFISDEHTSNHLYIQTKQGQFEDLAVEYGVNAANVSQGASFGDVDGDGYPDLYVCNWLAPDLFYRNNNGDSFESVSLPIRHLNDTLNSNGICFGDIDNDGDLDLLVTDRNGQSGLYRNDTDRESGKWQFTDITYQTGLINPYPAYSGLICDLNNDGWQDILFTNIGPNLLFLNRKSESFELVYKQETASGVKLKYYSTGAAVADLDNDGDLDLFIANKDTNCVLYVNPLDQSDFIRFALEGVRSNRDAVGSKVWLFEQNDAGEPSTLLGYREISGGSGYLSFSEPILHFGLSTGNPVSVRIRFPSGQEIVRTDLIPGRQYNFIEYRGLSKALVRTQHFLGYLIQNPDFWINIFLFLVLLSILGGFLSLAIRRYRWPNRQIVGYVVGSLIVLYFISGLLAGRTIQYILQVQIGFFIGIIALIAGFMERIYKLEKKRFEYRQVLHNFSEQLIFIHENDELYRQLVEIIHTTMRPRFCALMELTNQHLELKARAGGINVEIGNVEVNRDQHRKLIRSQIHDHDALQRYMPDLEKTGTQLAISIGRQGKLFALLLLGAYNGRNIAEEDSSLLTLLANQTALAIENNLFIEETKSLTRKVTEAATREKYIYELEEKNTVLEKLYRELKETQIQLIQSEKMSGLGQLVAGIAHELNNPISFIYANMKELQKYIEILNAKVNDKPGQKGDSSEMEFIRKDILNLMTESIEGSKRVKQIVEILRNFSHLDEAEIKEADIHEGLDSTLMLLNKEFSNRIIVQKDYGELPLVKCFPGYLNQVFMNLLLNAAQAIEAKGSINITTRTAGKYVFIEISDDGHGIPAAVQEKIFDPFYTTKPVGKGTGLGLSISYGIIRQHGGTIVVKSKEGKGTTFTVRLPLRFSQENIDHDDIK